MDEVSLADWLQAWGTVAGTCLSALAALVALGLFRHEVRVRRQDEADALARQARGVFATIESDPGLTHLTQVDIVVHNLSAAAVTDLYVAIVRADTGAVGHWFRSDVFAAGTWRSPFTLHPPVEVGPDRYPPDEFDFLVWFTDSRGRSWGKRNRGQPFAIQETPRRCWEQTVPQRARPTGPAA